MKSCNAADESEKKRNMKNGHTSGWSGRIVNAPSTSDTRMKWSSCRNQLISVYALSECRRPSRLEAAFNPVREWSSIGRNSVGSSGLGVAPKGKMLDARNRDLMPSASLVVHVPRCSVLPAPTRFMVARVTASRPSSADW